MIFFLKFNAHYVHQLFFLARTPDRHGGCDNELAADPDADGENVKRETDSVEGERQHRRRPYEIRPPERPGRARWFA